MKTRAKAVRCWAVVTKRGSVISIETEYCRAVDAIKQGLAHPDFGLGIGDEIIIRGTFTPAAPKPGGKGKRKP